jgi:hypothetical protein
MRPAQAALLALLAAGLGGCFGSRSQPTIAYRQPGGPFEGPTGDDVVQIHHALVERPCGDRFLNHELWDLADEQAVPLERKVVLEENGFRVCQIAGLPPAGLQALLSSPRSCKGMRRVSAHAGTATQLPVGAAWPRCVCRVKAGPGEGEEVALDKAQCLLEVVPTLAEDGRVTLHFTPRLRHGEQKRIMEAKATCPDGPLDWNVEMRQPEEAYPATGWEVTVGPGEYVVVGARLDRPDTLGQRFFLPSGEPARQCLLVVRAAPGSAGPPAARRGPAPLALQAGWTTARGTSK